MWSLPTSNWPEASVLARTLGLVGSLVTALYVFAWAHSPAVGLRVRAPTVLVAVATLAAAYAWIAPDTRSGDWNDFLSMIRQGVPVAKWYGASLAVIGFHRIVGPIFDIPPVESAKWLSCLCGALTAYVHFLTVHALGLTRSLRTWPFLYASAFGVVGVGLAHVEIYAPVVLVFSVLLWTGVAAFESTRPARVIAVGVAAGFALVSYISMLLAVPALCGAFAYFARVGARKRDAKLLGAVAIAIALAVLPTWVARAAGPESRRGHELTRLWQTHILSDELEWPSPQWGPPDLAWPLRHDLINPKYWFSSWHLSNFGQHLVLNDRAGFALVLAFLAMTAARPRGTRRLWTSPSLLFLSAVAASYFAFSFVVLNRYPFPRDWNLIGYTVLPINLLAAGALARSADSGRYGRVPGVLLALLGALALYCGVQFLSRHSLPPGA